MEVKDIMFVSAVLAFIAHEAYGISIKALKDNWG